MEKRDIMSKISRNVAAVELMRRPHFETPLGKLEIRDQELSQFTRFVSHGVDPGRLPPTNDVSLIPNGAAVAVRAVERSHFPVVAEIDCSKSITHLVRGRSAVESMALAKLAAVIVPPTLHVPIVQYCASMCAACSNGDGLPCTEVNGGQIISHELGYVPGDPGLKIAATTDSAP